MRASPLRIVIVDDYAPMRRLVGELLERAGCVIVGEAADGRAGLDLLAREPCDVVVMDYRMPVMDGIEATRAVHERWPSVAIAAFTSDDDAAVAALLEEAGASAHFVKTDIDGLVGFITGLT